MITRPTDHQWIAMARLARSEDGLVLIGLLKAELQEVKDRALVIDQESQIRQMQGRGQQLRDLVEALESAPDLVVKLDNRATRR